MGAPSCTLTSKSLIYIGQRQESSRFEELDQSSHKHCGLQMLRPEFFPARCEVILYENMPIEDGEGIQTARIDSEELIQLIELNEIDTSGGLASPYQARWAL
jgi:hypothetical protein